MISIKVKFRSPSAKGREGAIYYQIIHERKVRQLFSGYKVLSSEWDKSRSMVTVKAERKRAPLIQTIRECIRKDVERLTKIGSRLDASGLTYTADDLIEEFRRYIREYTLFNYMENVIAGLRHNKKNRTSETYRSALNSFRRFRQDKDILLDSLTPGIIESYEAWHKSRGVVPNTISFYMRILRAVYNRAVEDGIIEDCNPFRKVYTGIDKTVKRALPLSVVKKIKSLDLSLKPTLNYARDMFLMSFYLRGMSFVDMAFLRKSDLRNGYVTYRRRKTGQQLIIKWTVEMQAILNRYPDNPCGYLLPVIRKAKANEWSCYRNAAYNINHSLKIIAGMVGVTMPLTLYVARHSWASAAKAKGIPVQVISEGMGHDSETTTRIYLASLDTSVVDKANTIILKSLR
ncbi:MAG: site-specific integrase [Muribaculaceae bacterium]|nr:site-specific integrase [Muribaculaceae bacterium]